jgi:hypothetical protein
MSKGNRVLISHQSYPTMGGGLWPGYKLAVGTESSSASFCAIGLAAATMLERREAGAAIAHGAELDYIKIEHGPAGQARLRRRRHQSCKSTNCPCCPQLRRPSRRRCRSPTAEAKLASQTASPSHAQTVATSTELGQGIAALAMRCRMRKRRWGRDKAACWFSG